MTVLGGIDIGGTKCAVVIGISEGSGIRLVGKRMYPTPPTPELALDSFVDEMKRLMEAQGIPKLDSVGVSCGGPLDSRSGLVLSPPNLPHWDRIDVVSPLKRAFGAPVGLQNDANACALAEWKWGAGRGCNHMIFLTFGTGMGAGLILNGALFAGANDMAGEVGHMRLEDDGPTGYGKLGSFEGFCSGGGIAQLARRKAEEQLQMGNPPSFCTTMKQLSEVSAKRVGEAAQQGDPLAVEIFETVGRQLGKGLAVLVDVINPQRIVIGSIFARQRALLEPAMRETLEREALSISLGVCEIVPAALGESVGDLASLSVAANVFLEQK
jgi:glucokinase